jgi:hypothetical protein
VDYDDNEDWQRWNHVGKGRILRRVDETPVIVRTPLAEYCIRRSVGSEQTKISSLGGGSCATEASTVAVQDQPEHEKKEPRTRSIDLRKVKLQEK